TIPDDLPTKLENENLVFNNVNEECDKRLATTINLKNGLPKQFFRKCKGEYGDIYSFSSE
ncbi:MAG TPA: hypothetical protein VFU05_03235, partial [Cyclobacteriaceae bacterium]|nr:hypothetical protein [Cyclobacteriaceae bacterium]